MVIQIVVNFVNEAEIFFYLLSPDWNKVFARGGTAAKEGIVRLGVVFFDFSRKKVFKTLNDSFWLWQNNHLKMYLLSKMMIFHCHLSLLEGTSSKDRLYRDY